MLFKRLLSPLAQALSVDAHRQHTLGKIEERVAHAVHKNMPALCRGLREALAYRDVKGSADVAESGRLWGIHVQQLWDNDIFRRGQRLTWWERSVVMQEGAFEFTERTIGRPVEARILADDAASEHLNQRNIEDRLDPVIGTLPKWRVVADARQAAHMAAIREGALPECAGGMSLSAARSYYSLNMLQEEAWLRGEMSGAAFEEECAQVLRAEGWNCEVTKASGDQGVDIVARKWGKVLVVQCKRYKGSVGNAAVQEIYAAKAHKVADFAVVVTTGQYTRSAIELGKSTRVDLVQVEKLSSYAATLI